MDLNLLKVFEALYEEGGASRAAVRLALTQSAVSAALARLRVFPCPLALPGYPVELGWRTSSQRDPAVMQVRDAIAACVEPFVSDPSGSVTAD